MMKSINQDNITILNFYAHNNIASKLIKQKLIELQGEITI